MPVPLLPLLRVFPRSGQESGLHLPKLPTLILLKLKVVGDYNHHNSRQRSLTVSYTGVMYGGLCVCIIVVFSFAWLVGRLFTTTQQQQQQR